MLEFDKFRVLFPLYPDSNEGKKVRRKIIERDENPDGGLNLKMTWFVS